MEKQQGWGGRGGTAWAALAVAAALLAAGCGRTGWGEPRGSGRDGATFDAAYDATPPDGDAGDALDAAAEDASVEEVPAELPPGTCDTLCTFLVGECGVRLPGGSCEAICPRLEDGILWCLLDAQAKGDCDAVPACFEEAPPVEECDPVCEFANECFSVPVSVCEDQCRLVNEEVRSCMGDALEDGDCTWLWNCLIYPGGNTERCAAVCDLVINRCGFDLGIDAELCTLGCTMGIVEGLLLDCAGVAAVLGSCALMGLCLVLAPPDLPGG